MINGEEKMWNQHLFIPAKISTNSYQVTKRQDFRFRYIFSEKFRQILTFSLFFADTETTFIENLEGGDRHRAMKRLRVPPLGKILKN